MRRIDLPESPRYKIECTGDQQIGKLLDADIVEINRIVEELAAVGDLILELRNPRAELTEGLVGLELRLAFNHHEQ